MNTTQHNTAGTGHDQNDGAGRQSGCLLSGVCCAVPYVPNLRTCPLPHPAKNTTTTTTTITKTMRTKSLLITSICGVRGGISTTATAINSCLFGGAVVFIFISKFQIPSSNSTIVPVPTQRQRYIIREAVFVFYSLACVSYVVDETKK
mmetsp:Transcript_20619/g.22067  ORF Transcript_20619/g.22067 Transcript_20619/m.22067 type:complete len:148 (-) Transcript_20619:1079-1522(-)